MKLNRSGLAVVLAMALLAFGTAGLVAAQEDESGMETETVTLTGQLSESADGGFVLTEPESGEEVVVDGPGVADHVGSTVTVTGTWATDEEGNTYLAVSTIETSDEAS
jgi:hypothetical protein